MTKDEFYKLTDAAIQIYESKNIKSIRDEWIKDRNCMIMELSWVVGSRITDTLHFKRVDFDMYNKTIKFYVHKRNHYHKVPLEAEVLMHVQNYILKWWIE